MYYIYKKTHNITGLQYLGYTKNDPYKYKGSGVRWVKHLLEHGNDVTTIVLETCKTKEEVRQLGIYYSELFDVVKSRDWANMKKEEADGGDMSTSETWIQGRKTIEFRIKQSEGAKGNTNVRGYKWWRNKITGEKVRSINSPGEYWENKFEEVSEKAKQIISEKLKGKPKSQQHKDKLKLAAKNRPSNSKGTIWVKNKEGKRKRVYPDNIPEGYER